jgi:hypothetical protein
VSFGVHRLNSCEFSYVLANRDESMTLTELRAALAQAVATGKLGTPVSARVHVQLAESECDLPSVLGGVLRMLSPAFDEPPARIRARKHASAPQWNLLLRTTTGRTIFITVGCGSRATAALDLLVVGNHGIVQLQGGDAFEWEPQEEPRPAWMSQVDEAIATGREIALTT